MMKTTSLALLLLSPLCFADPPSLRTPLASVRLTKSKLLGGASIRSSAGVPTHLQTEAYVLPYLETKKALFPGAVVLDIGTGNGIIAIYAASRGAKKVFATDINPVALGDVLYNAKGLGVSALIETKLVPANSSSAYAVFSPTERFDLIIANPPYTVDISSENANFTDASLLGPSIIAGLKNRLTEDGQAILLYRNLFYHMYLAKLARHYGLHVKSYHTDTVPRRELEILFNSYAQKLNKALELKDGVVFDAETDELKDLKVTVQGPEKRPDFVGLLILAKKASRL